MSDLCGCDESMRYYAALLDVETWLVQLGAGNIEVGPMNGDEGAASVLIDVRAAIAQRYFSGASR